MCRLTCPACSCTAPTRPAQPAPDRCPICQGDQEFTTLWGRVPCTWCEGTGLAPVGLAATLTGRRNCPAIVP